MNLTQKDKKTIMSAKIEYKNIKMFLHCDHCLSKFLKSADYLAGLVSPEMFCKYEISSYPFTYPDGTNANIMAAWCSHCKKQVWDSRHLTALF